MVVTVVRDSNEQRKIEGKFEFCKVFQNKGIFFTTLEIFSFWKTLPLLKCLPKCKNQWNESLCLQSWLPSSILFQSKPRHLQITLSCPIQWYLLMLVFTKRDKREKHSKKVSGNLWVINISKTGYGNDCPWCCAGYKDYCVDYQLIVSCGAGGNSCSSSGAIAAGAELDELTI